MVLAGNHGFAWNAGGNREACPRLAPSWVAQRKASGSGENPKTGKEVADLPDGRRVMGVLKPSAIS